MSTTLSSHATPSDPLIHANTTQVVVCKSGAHEFLIGTDCLTGIYHLTPKQINANATEFNTADGILTISPMADLLAQHFGIDISSAAGENSLIAIGAGDEHAALRVENVSKPMTLCQSKFFPIPRIAHPHDSGDVIRAIAVFNENACAPQDALRLLIDPARALGFASNSHLFPVDAPGAAGTNRAAKTRRSARQLLIFMPEDVCSQQCDFVFGLPVAAIAEVTSMLPPVKWAMASPLLAGYVFWRKIPVPVIHLGACFGLPQPDAGEAESQPRRRLVVARLPGHRYVGVFTQTDLQLLKALPNASSCQIDSLQDKPQLGAFDTEYGNIVVPDLDTIMQTG